MRLALISLMALSLAQPAMAARRGRPEVAGAEERKAVAVFAKCVIERSRLKARSVLTSDFRTPSYSKGLKELGTSNQDCMKTTGHRSMRTDGLPFAAALAEVLMEQGDKPLNIRLAKAAGGTPVTGFTPSDTLAICIARSMPDEVAKLFATEIGSEAEGTAAQALAPAIAPCTPKSFVSRTGSAGLRATLATASYRLLAAQES